MTAVHPARASAFGRRDGGMGGIRVAAGDWFDGGGSGAVVDVPDVLGSGALDAFVRVVGTGALVSFGLSRDGGALACTVTFDGRWRREWFRDSDALTAWLETAEMALTDMTATPLPASQARANGVSKPSTRRDKAR